MCRLRGRVFSVSNGSRKSTQALSFNNYLRQLIRSQLTTLLREKSEIQISIVHNFTGGRRVFIKHTRPRRSHINITKVDDYLTIHLSNICYNLLLGSFNFWICLFLCAPNIFNHKFTLHKNYKNWLQRVSGNPIPHHKCWSLNGGLE